MTSCSCFNFGNCTSVENCECPIGFTGDKCEKPRMNLYLSPYLRPECGGLANPNRPQRPDGASACTCDDGWQGINCNSMHDRFFLVAKHQCVEVTRLAEPFWMMRMVAAFIIVAFTTRTFGNAPLQVISFRIFYSNPRRQGDHRASKGKEARNYCPLLKRSPNMLV